MAPEPVPTPVVKPLEGARSSLSAPLPGVAVPLVYGKDEVLVDCTEPPDLRPPPKDERGMSKRVSSHDTLTDDPPKESRFGKIGKRKPGRPKKGSKS